ncbi:EF-hand domain-containing protein [Oceaniglobus roseus]|uniref:EF-hand domain-containing protein n=1 Tax=Oceaniglobus roseus TaxID=1737570 RepID=UPI000C7F0772|nr:EF-hand domain-containing protein [Kandeliimicrobium roseum]
MTQRTPFLSLAAALALGTAAFVSPAAAQESDAMRGPMQPPAFSELDSDGNGQITASDLEAYAAARFAEADTDGNGSLSAEELTARAMARAQERAERMTTRMLNTRDIDGDGALSREEMEAGRGGRDHGRMGMRMLQRADRDGDGAVSEEEYTAATERMAEMMERHHGKGRHGMDHDRGKGMDHHRGGKDGGRDGERHPMRHD